MNIMHLKYAVEVEKTRSINKAAENLFMGQPNLSRAIKELEENLGITVFKRTPKGMTPTEKGIEFLARAKHILAQIDAMEAMYKSGESDKQEFRISVPRAGYIASAFTELSKQLDPNRGAELYYKETNSMRAINNILHDDYNIGIIRYQSAFEPYFATMLYDKGLKSKEIWEFPQMAVMSKNHPLAKNDVITLDDLSGYTELAYGDPYVPSMPIADVKKAELPEVIDKRIFVFERGIRFELLTQVNGTFMWDSPMREDMLVRYSLIQRKPENVRIYKDVLIYKKDYHFTELDKEFFVQVEQSRADISI